MARWIESPIGAVNLDELTQLGTELRGSKWDIIGWSSTGQRFAVRDGYLTRDDALTGIAGLVDPRGPITHPDVLEHERRLHDG